MFDKIAPVYFLILNIQEFNNNIILLITLVIFGFSFIIQLIYYLGFFSRIFLTKKKKNIHRQDPVSVIICAKNEAENLKCNLPLILNQNYPSYEVVVINDCSSDESEEVLASLAKEYSHLKYTNILEDSKFKHSKKLALTLGIKSSKHETLLLTDADCTVSSADWISLMQKNYDENTEIVLGYGGYSFQKGWMDKLIRYDTLFIAMQYINYALAGIPYMGVGRNLSYKKSLFFKNKGFASHACLKSGDDDLFVNECATPENTKIEIHPSAHTRSEQVQTFSAWIRQKKRHLTTGNRYKLKHKILLSAELISRVFFYVSFVFLLFWFVPVQIVISAFVFRLMIQFIVLKLTLNRLKEKNLLLVSIIFDICLPFVYLYLFLTSYFAGKKIDGNRF